MKRARPLKSPAPQPAPQPTSRPLRLAINAFLIFHIVSIACWALPIHNPVVDSCRNWIRPYFLWSGLFQSWDPFSPSPKSVNSYAEAIVLYQDGNTRNWPFPRMDQLGFAQRYAKERYRKFVENLEDDKNSALWPDAARFIARANNNAANPVKMVLLVRYWSAILPSSSGAFRAVPWDEHVFYSYPVQAQDLP